MKSIFVFLLFICVFTVSCSKAADMTPIETAREFFELSRNEKFEDTSKLWSTNRTDKPGEPIVKSNPENQENFRFDLSYAREIFDYRYEILDYKEFPKSEASTVLCLLLKHKSGELFPIYRVELSLSNEQWKINRMMNAEADALAMINKDCSTVNFNR